MLFIVERSMKLLNALMLQYARLSWFLVPWKQRQHTKWQNNIRFCFWSYWMFQPFQHCTSNWDRMVQCKWKKFTELLLFTHCVLHVRFLAKLVHTTSIAGGFNYSQELEDPPNTWKMDFTFNELSITAERRRNHIPLGFWWIICRNVLAFSLAYYNSAVLLRESDKSESAFSRAAGDGSGRKKLENWLNLFSVALPKHINLLNDRTNPPLVSSTASLSQICFS